MGDCLSSPSRARIMTMIPIITGGRPKAMLAGCMGSVEETLVIGVFAHAVLTKLVSTTIYNQNTVFIHRVDVSPGIIILLRCII